MTRKEFIKKYNINNRNKKYPMKVEYEDLKKVNFHDLDLSNLHFYCCNLEETVFTNTILDNTDFKYCQLYHSLFEKIIITYYMSELNFECCDCKFSSFKDINVRCGITAGKSNFIQSDFFNCTLSSFLFYRTSLNHAHFTNFKSEIINIENCIGISSIISNSDKKFFNCPEKGSFIGFKKISLDKYNCNYAIAMLEIPADAKRSSAEGRKCRCDKAKVLKIYDIRTEEEFKEGYSIFDENFVYEVNKMVSVDNFDEDRWTECAPGIHFFITEQEAINY